MATYPGSPTLTVDALLRQPQLLARPLSSLTSRRFVADYIFAHGSPEQVAGGAAWFERSESIYPDRGAEEIGYRSEFPRSGWTEAIFSALVKKYGLEVPFSFESIRRNQIDKVARGQRKLANALTKFVDTAAMTLLTTDAAVLTSAALANWTVGATTIVQDLATMRKVIADQDEGYELDTLVVNGAQEYALLVNSTMNALLPREFMGGLPGQQPFGGNGPFVGNPIMTGRPVPIMGLRQILVTPQLTAGTVIGLNAKIAGTVADEQPGEGEGYVSYDVNAVNQGNALRAGPGTQTITGLGSAFNPNAGDFPNANYPAMFPPVWVKVYNEDRSDDKIVRAARWPAMYLAEPKSVYKLTGA
jgi:hypothetical protein